jgi:HSF-type DNA-binding
MMHNVPPPPAPVTAANHRAEVEDLFPAKLHYVLEQVEKDQEQHGIGGGDDDVISWQPHGRAFLVQDREKFVNEYLPKYVSVVTIGWRAARSARNRSAPAHVLPFVRVPPLFHSWFRQNTWASFQRQLNHYGFKRITAGTSGAATEHRCSHVSPSFCPNGFQCLLTMRSRQVPVSPRRSLSFRATSHDLPFLSRALVVRMCLLAKTDRNAYYHPCFVKYDRDLCRFIRRVTCKGAGPRKPSNPEEQPNFYRDADPFHAVALSHAVHQPVSSPSCGGTPSSFGAPPPRMVSRGSSADASVSSSVAVALSASLLPVYLGSAARPWAHPRGCGRADPPTLVSMMGGVSCTLPAFGPLPSGVAASRGSPLVLTTYRQLLVAAMTVSMDALQLQRGSRPFNLQPISSAYREGVDHVRGPSVG